MTRPKLLLFAVISTIVALALLESAARVAEFLYPDQRKRQAVSQTVIPPKEAGTFRILTYGGSTMAGSPLRPVSFVSQLRFWLKELNPELPVEVINLGDGGTRSEHVRREVERTREDNADLIVVMTGHNEFLGGPGVERPLMKRLVKELEIFALFRVQSRAVRWLRSKLVEDTQIWQRDSEAFRALEVRYIENLEAIVRIAAAEQVPLILMTLASNLADWPPATPGVRSDQSVDAEYTASLAEATRLLAEGPAAVDGLRELLASRPDDASLLYLLGRAHRTAGDTDVARDLFVRAKDLDPVPWRVLSEFNEAIRAAAAADGVELVDIEALFERNAEDGFVGFPLIADNVHPTPIGSTLIARELVRVMRARGLFGMRDIGSHSPAEQLDRFLSQFSPDERRDLDLTYLLKNGRYTMKEPFYNFAASKMYLELAREADSSDWRVWANLATVSLLEGRNNAGRAELRRALALHDGPINPDDRENTPYLRSALERSGVVLAEME